jgi:hypothetical protein
MNNIKIDKVLADQAIENVKANTMNLIENEDFQKLFVLFGGTSTFLNEMKSTMSLEKKTKKGRKV